MLSLHARINLAALGVLAAFLGLTGLALDEAFRQSAETGMRERLQSHVYGLLAAADEDDQGELELPLALPDPRFSNPDSGLYARVRGEGGEFDWRSPSLVGRSVDVLRALGAGVWAFSRVRSGDQRLMAVSFGVIWEDDEGRGVPYTFAVAETLEPLMQEIAGFRRTLWAWLSGATLVLLMVQGLVLRWGLSPLRQVTGALQRIESGEEDRLKGDYPAELRGLTHNLNALLDRTRASQERYRNSLADLAHSLKTPLAILRGAAAEGGSATLRPTVDEQVRRMDEIVRHQLQRAAVSGRSTLIRSVPVAPVVAKVLGAMDKVYRDKAVQPRMEIAESVRFFGDEADLMEILGNLLDNAYKYCRSRVLVAAAAVAPEGAGRHDLELRVEDDGPGIPEEQVRIVLQRGRRVDQRQEGHGIGLSVVDEIVRLYEGRLSIGRSELGGVAIRVRLSG